jgi:serine/threonine protein kinase/Tol biopolymer transport system component
VSLTSGTRLGPYEILGPLGAGGMGEVYRAKDTRLGREVAIKVLPADVVQDPDRLARFEREAKAVSALNHPNIVTLYEVATSDIGPYLVLERIEGQSLRQVIASGPLPLRRLLHLSAQIADGLAKAHGAGIVHRDLKPDNVMVTDDGFAKIVDFGLAKLVFPELDAGPLADATTQVKRTESGLVLGTLGYLSPEQAAGKPADYRADQFALGALMYEMATGERPFRRETFLESLAATIRDEPEPLRSKRADAPPQLAWMVERCFAKDPNDRYASTKDLARDLGDLRDHLSEITRMPSPESSTNPVASSLWRRRSLLIAAAVALAVLFGASGRYVGMRQVVSQISQRSYQPLTFRRGTITGARFAPDSKTVYYSAAFGADESRVFRTSIDGGVESDLLKHVPSAFILSVSHQNELAVLLTNRHNQSASPGMLARVPALGGTPRPLLEGITDADWLPDSESLAVRYVDGRLEFPMGHQIPVGARMPRVSPDGKLVAFIVGDPTAIEIWDLQGQRHTTHNDTFAWGLAWSPDSREVWFSGSDTHSGYDRAIYALGLSGEARLVARVPGPITIQDIAPDGKGALVMSGAGVTSLTVLHAGQTQEQTIDLFGRTDFFTLSDDDRWILAHENREGAEGTYRLATDGSERVSLGPGRALGLSPDGNLALVERQDQLLLLPTGAGQATTLPINSGRQPNLNSAAQWSPDGKLFVLFEQEKHGDRIYVLDGEHWRPVTSEGADVGFAVSPDGRWVAAAISGTTRLFPIDGSGERPLTGAEGTPIRWSSDGWLFIRSRGQFPTRIYRHEIATGRNQPWREITPADPTGLFLIGGVQVVKNGEICVYAGTRGFNELFYARGLR